MPSSTNAQPTPLPRYIYKILPSSPEPPSPLPANLPLSALDRRDGFLHFSTSAQILGTLQNFFSSETRIFILRVPFEGVKKFVEWEDAKGKGPDEKGGCWDVEGRKGLFPHVYGNGVDGEEAGLRLGKGEVDEVGRWERGGERWGKEGWPFGEDEPRE
ncbi:uncharacterized protein PAC_10053 [Phialocephala subalpina]|uniref:DUF952 domain protein n=1 Tax=Phialocephala subalpina TaxID=576137 RepID=A0A1L7X592_9HELO|nr:uncharacterized protein PAC_10053 [Phialocephala subalpina]